MQRRHYPVAPQQPYTGSSRVITNSGKQLESGQLRIERLKSIWINWWPQQLAARTATVQQSTPGQPSEQYYFCLSQHNNPTRNACERVICKRRTNTPWKPATRHGFLTLPQHTIITSREPSLPTTPLPVFTYQHSICPICCAMVAGDNTCVNTCADPCSNTANICSDTTNPCTNAGTNLCTNTN